MYRQPHRVTSAQQRVERGETVKEGKEDRQLCTDNHTGSPQEDKELCGVGGA